MTRTAQPQGAAAPYSVVYAGDGRWLVVKAVAGLPPNSWLGVVDDCPSQAAAERSARTLNERNALAPWSRPADAAAAAGPAHEPACDD